MSIVVSKLTGGSNNHPTTSEEANGFATDFVSDGIVGAVGNTNNLAPATGGFAVNAQDTPDMTVAVAAGVLYVTATPASQNSQVLRVKNSASYDVTISANSSGSTKYDWVYLQIDATTAANPSLAGDDVGTLVTSRSTSNTTDDGTPPTYGYCLAVVTVANGASSITDSNIRDKRIQSQVQDQTSSTGWIALSETLEYTSNDGNKQATYTITGVDKTDTIQEGMKVKLPRVTSVGTQCTDLEASSSQYASKSSPSGITFTDDFTCGAWIKLESYGDGTNEMSIISRFLFNTGGFVLRVETNGALHTVVMNGATTDEVACYQSLPINKWVHVAQGIDLSTDTFTTYINGVSVSTYEVDSHTLSAIVQAGDLEIGSFNGGSDYFDGKIKHAFVADKVLSAAEVKEAMVSDDLTSASFSSNLDAYFKLEGDFTDSSANGNDLTAQNGATADNADSPFSDSEYGIITSATFSTDTTVAVDFGDKVPVNENVTAPAYSTHNVPYGFPIDVSHQQAEQIGGNVVGFQASLVSDQSLTTSTITTLSLGKVFYSDGNYDSSTYEYTVPYSGYYLCILSVGFKDSTFTRGINFVYVSKDGGSSYSERQRGPDLTETSLRNVNSSYIEYFDAGDMVIFRTFGTHAGSGKAEANDSYTKGSIVLVART